MRDLFGVTDLHSAAGQKVQSGPADDIGMQLAHSRDDHQSRSRLAYDLIGDGGPAQKPGVLARQGIQVRHSPSREGTDFAVSDHQRVIPLMQQSNQFFHNPYAIFP